MNRIKDTLLYLFSWIFVASGVISCQQEEEWTAADMGFLVTLNEAVTVATKATPAELDKPVADNFYLSIIKESTGKVIYNGNYSAELVPASAGTYILMATCGEDPILAWDTPYYAGMETTDLADGETKQVDITCRVANALLSVTFNEPELFAQLYDEYGVRVSTSGMSLDISGSRTDRSAYFRAGANVSLLFYARLVDGGSEVTYSLDEAVADIFPLQAGQHAKLTLSSSNTAVQVDKAEVETVTIEETLPLEWLPKPKVESTGFVDNQLNFVETETPQASIRLNMASALQEMKLKFNFQDPQFASLNATEEKPEYLLSNAADKQAIEQTLGITLPSIGDTQAAVDLSSLVARMQSLEDAATVNTIELDVQANNRWSSENAEVNRVYTLTCSQPVFSVEVLPGNIWTKEFTASTLTAENVTSGNVETLAANLTYQYRTGEGEWTTFNDGLRQDGLTPGTSYQVRALYRGVVSSNLIEIRTYEAYQIPNSSFDEGYATTYPKSDNPLYTFDGGWIGTRNPLTCHSSGVNAFYVSKSSTLPISDNGSIVAYMMTIGWGEGNTCAFGNKTGSVINNISSGIVCVGDYDSSNDAIAAKEAYLRPTSMTYTYKANPYNNDEYLISVELINRSIDNTETVVGSGVIQSGIAVNEYTTTTLDIVYNTVYDDLPITHIKILFQAGTQEDRDHLENSFRDASLWDGYANAYIMGSQFWLDSFILNYDK